MIIVHRVNNNRRKMASALLFLAVGCVFQTNGIVAFSSTSHYLSKATRTRRTASGAGAAGANTSTRLQMVDLTSLLSSPSTLISSLTLPDEVIRQATKTAQAVQQATATTTTAATEAATEAQQQVAQTLPEMAPPESTSILDSVGGALINVAYAATALIFLLAALAFVSANVLIPKVRGSERSPLI